MMTKPASVLPKSNFTIIPNSFFDFLIGEIDSFAELQITLVVIRKTNGYRKPEDSISLSQFENMSKLSRPSVIEGIQKAIARGYVTRRQGKRYNGQEYFYSITFPVAMPMVLKQPEQVTTDNPLTKDW